MEDALALIAQWEQAYRDLERENAQLLHRYITTLRDLEHARAAIDNDLFIAAFEPADELVF